MKIKISIKIDTQYIKTHCPWIKKNRLDKNIKLRCLDKNIHDTILKNT